MREAPFQMGQTARPDAWRSLCEHEPGGATLTVFHFMGGRLLVAFVFAGAGSVTWSAIRHQAREPMRDVGRRASLLAAAALVIMAIFTFWFPLSGGWEGTNPVEEFRAWTSSSCGPAYRYHTETDEGCADTDSQNLWHAGFLAGVGVISAVVGIGLLRERPTDGRS
ncbi:MAG TPA: hypothetical protein VFA83_18535 [Acidimicrobiales bacterium]|nr:hypothetical protein [Acidimicrobiales bacterium]